LPRLLFQALHLVLLHVRENRLALVPSFFVMLPIFTCFSVD
jgi:hypothetical protein